jgi:membrane fusion protein (multidrug efflux system)
VVHGLTVVKGEILTAGAAICSLFDNQNLEAAVNVLEADLGDLAVGRPVMLAIPATGDTLRARVDVLSPRLDEASRTCEAVIRFNNPHGRFRPGMFVRAEIAGWVHSDLLLVPKAAVLVRDERPLVFKAADDRAQWLYVDVGRQNDRWVEIAGVHSGGSLEPGDSVVVSNHLTLAHEARLAIDEVLAPRDRWVSGGAMSAQAGAREVAGAEPGR